MNSPPMTLGHRSQGLPVRSPDEIRSSVHSGQSHGGIAHDNLGLITAPARGVAVRWYWFAAASGMHHYTRRHPSSMIIGYPLA